MKITRIVIERFLGIRKIDLELNQDLQLIAGPNNAGKSTILKAMHLFFKSFDEEEIPLSEFVPQNSYYDGEGSRAQTKIRLYFSDLNESEINTFQKAYQYRNKELWCEIKITKRYLITYGASGTADGEETYTNVVNLFDVIYIPAIRTTQDGSHAGETRKLFIATKDVLSRTRKGSLNELQKKFEQSANTVTRLIGDLLTESKKAVESTLPSGADIDFKFPNPGDILDLILSKTKIGTRTNTGLTVEDEGTGFQSLLSLGLLKYVQGMPRQRTLLMLVEEPEAFLHPQFQRSVSEYLKSLSSKSQLIITTHSPVLIDSTPLRHTLRIIRQPDGLQYNWNWNQKDDSDTVTLDRYCDTKASEVIFADKVILCEGITDSNIYGVITEKLFESLHHKNISILRGDGSAIRHLARLLDWFGIEHIIILDKDAYNPKGRQTLKDICRDKRKPLSDHDFNELNKAWSAVCTDLKSMSQSRDAANNTLFNRNIFVLGSDIEGAVVSSFSKHKVIEHLGPTGVRHLSSEACLELNELGGHDATSRIFELVGSKGWSNESSKKDNKPKPHLLSNFIREAGFAFRDHSDLKKLSEIFKSFIDPELKSEVQL